MLSVPPLSSLASGPPNLPELWATAAPLGLMAEDPSTDCLCALLKPLVTEGMNTCKRFRKCKEQEGNVHFQAERPQFPDS